MSTPRSPRSKSAQRKAATGLLTQAELAKALDVTRQLVHRLDRQGMGRDGMDGERPLYKLERCRTWYQANVTSYGHGGDRPGSGARRRVRKRSGPELFDEPAPTDPKPTTETAPADAGAGAAPNTAGNTAGNTGGNATDEKQRSASASLTELKGEHEQLRVIERRAQLRRQMGELGERAEMLRIHARHQAKLRDLVEREAKRAQDDLVGQLKLDQAGFVLLERRVREMVTTIRERMASGAELAASATEVGT